MLNIASNTVILALDFSLCKRFHFFWNKFSNRHSVPQQGNWPKKKDRI